MLIGVSEGAARLSLIGFAAFIFGGKGENIAIQTQVAPKTFENASKRFDTLTVVFKISCNVSPAVNIYCFCYTILFRNIVI